MLWSLSAVVLLSLGVLYKLNQLASSVASKVSSPLSLAALHADAASLNAKGEDCYSLTAREHLRRRGSF